MVFTGVEIDSVITPQEEPEQPEEPKPHQENNVGCSPSAKANASESPTTTPSHNGENPSVNSKYSSSDEDNPPVNLLDTFNHEEKPPRNGESTSSNGEKHSVNIMNTSSVGDENSNTQTKKGNME